MASSPTPLLVTAGPVSTPSVRRSPPVSSWPTGPWGRCSRRRTRRWRTSSSHEGCNEILNVTRPDIVRGGPRGVLRGRRRLRRDQHLRRQPRGPRRVRHHRADRGAVRGRRADRPRGRRRAPHHRAAALGAGLDGARHQAADPRPRALTPTLRDAYQQQRRRPDRRRRRRAAHRDLPGPAAGQGRDHRRQARDRRRRHRTCRSSCRSPSRQNGTMLLGSEIGAALTALEPLGIDVIGLNCATGPAEMSEHLRYLARHSRIPLSCMPNAGLPELTTDGAHYPLTPGRARRRPRHLHRGSSACRWSAAAAARRPSTCARSSSGCAA